MTFNNSLQLFSAPKGAHEAHCRGPGARPWPRPAGPGVRWGPQGPPEHKGVPLPNEISAIPPAETLCAGGCEVQIRVWKAFMFYAFRLLCFMFCFHFACGYVLLACARVHVIYFVICSHLVCGYVPQLKSSGKRNVFASISASPLLHPPPPATVHSSPQCNKGKGGNILGDARLTSGCEVHIRVR